MQGKSDCDFAFMTEKTKFVIKNQVRKKNLLFIDGSRNMRVKYCCDAKAYENYYLSQVGHGMPYFAGARVQQGYGLGNLFSSIAKSVLPLV